MSRRRTIVNGTTEYSSSSSSSSHSYGDGECETDGYTESQFLKPPQKFPWKPILFILGFLCAGVACLCFGILISTGYYDAKYQDRAWPLLMLGILMFIPGGYYGYILICICLKRDGFTLEEIPIF